MPYNTTPIDPPKEYSGQANLPLARTKKIIQADPDIAACSNNAAFAITVATESFIRYLSGQAHTISRSTGPAASDRHKSRRTVAYKDVATAVHKYDNLEFLLDVVPRTISYGQWKERQAKVKDGEGRKGNGEVNGNATATATGEGKGGNRDVREMMGRREGETRTRLITLDGVDEREDEMDVDGEGRVDRGADADDDATESDEEEGVKQVVRTGASSGTNGRIEAKLPMEDD